MRKVSNEVILENIEESVEILSDVAEQLLEDDGYNNPVDSAAIIAGLVVGCYDALDNAAEVIGSGAKKVAVEKAMRKVFAAHAKLNDAVGNPFLGE